MVKCCVCDKALVNDTWDFVSEEDDENVLVSHGFCPECFEQAIADAEREFACSVAAT